MYYEELVKRLREHNGWALNETLDQAADAIEELSRRETPIRVRLTTSTTRCPSCNKQLTGRGNIHRFCRRNYWCGQAIDWSDLPKEE